MVQTVTSRNNSGKLQNQDIYLLETSPDENANNPDIVVLNKENDTAYVIEGTICETDKTEETTLAKQNRYTDLRYGLKRLYPLDTIIQINVIMDFVGGYHSELINLLGKRKTVCQLLMDCQKWVLSQNHEIIKKTL